VINVYKKHPNQRWAFFELKEFLENPPDGCKIAVLTGIRRIGKTGVLTDICASMENAKYINFGRDSMFHKKGKISNASVDINGNLIPLKKDFSKIT